MNPENRNERPLTIATTIAPKEIEKQRAAVDSWLAAGFLVVSVNSPEEIEAVRPAFPDVSFAAASRDARPIAGRPYIYLDDILGHLQQSGSEISGIVNSDILLRVPGDFQRFIRQEARNALVYGSRVDVASLDSQQGAFYETGFDFFFFPRSVAALYPRTDFCLGLPWWDYWMVLYPILREAAVKKLVSPIAFHLLHPARYSEEKWNSFGLTLAETLLKEGLLSIQGNIPLQSISAERFNQQISLSTILKIIKKTSRILCGPAGLPDVTPPKAEPAPVLRLNDVLVREYEETNLLHRDLATPEETETARLFALGYPEETRLLLHDMLMCHPDHRAVLDNIAAIEMLRGHTAVARELLERLVQDDPQNATARRNLDLLLEQKRTAPRDHAVRVSAIVSTYNAERFIRGCLDDLVAQTLFQAGELEIIVIDSASREQEGRIVQEFQRQHPPIRYIRTPQRETVYAAWNRGIRLAQGRYITNANTDDRHREDALELMADMLDALPGVSLVYADALVTEREQESFSRNTSAHTYRWSDWDRTVLLTKGCFIGPQPLWRKSVHALYGYFDETLVTSGDYEFWLRISQTTDFHHLRLPLGLYLKHPDSIEHRNRYAQRSENSRIMKLYQDAERSGMVVRYELSPECPPEERSRFRLRANSKRPVTSLVVRASGHASSMRKTIEGLIRHTPEAHELILVVDAAAGKEYAWFRQVSTARPHYRLLPVTGPVSPAGSFNRGIEASIGDTIVVIDGPLAVPEGWLSPMLAALAASPRNGIVSPRVSDLPDSGPRPRHLPPDAPDPVQQALRFRQWPTDRISATCLLFPRRLAETAGPFDEGLPSADAAVEDLRIRAEVRGFTSVLAAGVVCSRDRAAAQKDRGPGREQRPGRETPAAADRAGMPGEGAAFVQQLHSARDLWLRDENGRAVSALLHAIGQAPDDLRSYLELARLFIREKDFAKALDVLDSVPESWRNDVEAMTLGACCREGLGCLSEASQMAEQILRRNPRSAAALNLAGAIAHREHRDDDALDWFRKAAAADPSFGEAWTNLGILAWSRGERQEALALLEAGFILDPASQDAMTALYTAAGESGALDRLERTLADAHRLLPTHRRLHFLLISARLQQGRHQAAMDAVREAMDAYGIDDNLLTAALQVREMAGPLTVSAAGRTGISLCMIVRNEEQNLPRCLSSVLPLVDEIIVTDTGSTDRTKDVARAYGAQVGDFAWTGDFSEARNHALARASGSWILVLDADEVLAAEDLPVIRNAVARSHPSTAYSLVTRNYVRDRNMAGLTANDGASQEERGSGWVPSRKVRLFPRDDRIRFEYPVHEVVDHALARCGYAIRELGTPVHHYGKLDAGRTALKGEAYYQLGRAKLDQLQNDLNAVSELALQAAELGRFDEAVELWQRVLEKEHASPLALANIGYAYLQLGRYQEARDASQRARRSDPASSQAGYNEALAELYLGNAGGAAALLETVLRSAQDHVAARYLLGVAYCVTGRRAEGRDLFERMRSQHADIAAPLLRQMQVLIRLGRQEDAAAVIGAAMEAGVATDELRQLVGTV